MTSEQARLLERATKDAALPSKSEFVRCAIAPALEQKLKVQAIQEVFEGRQQIRARETCLPSEAESRGIDLYV